MLNPAEPLSAAARTQLEAQLGLATSLADTVINNMGKFVDLNLKAAKASFDTSIAGSQQLLAAKDPQEFLSLTTYQSQPHAEIALTYGQHLAALASGAQNELSKVADAQLTASSRRMMYLLDQFGQMAPAGSENTITLMRTALDNVSAGVEQLSRSGKMAMQTMESNLKAAATQVTAGTRQTHAKSSHAKK